MKTGKKICFQDWFNENCTKFCKEQPGGNYICNSFTGEKRCLNHYYGINCQTYCYSDQSSNYNCNAVGKIVCHKDYHGINCDEYGKLWYLSDLIRSVFRTLQNIYDGTI